VPELPELQALAERLTEHLAGATLERADVLHFSALKTVEPTPFDIEGRALTGVGRRGKYLLFELSGLTIALHLSQGGRIDLEDPPKTTRPKGAVVRFRFDRPPSLLVKEYGTERKAAWWVLGPDDAGPTAKLGPEPFDAEFERFVRESSERRHVHTMLRDQRTVAGIGRGYSDDILHAAHLSPYASLNSLDADQRGALMAAIKDVLERSLESERAKTGGLPAKLGDRFAIHNRHGTACPRCGETMQRVWYESHEITYCPSCQTGGKVLADRRMSRLLK
jgi:formamidopyrimidine-DNA glycosylase